MRDWLITTGRGALIAAASVAVAYVAAAYTTVPLDEPWRQIVALTAVALFNRFVRR